MDTDPRDIPGGYCEQKHARLANTMKSGIESVGGQLRVFACHATKPGKDLACVGWLAHQLGPGNNIGLRLAVLSGRIDADFRLVGEQHQYFEDTLPGD